MQKDFIIQFANPAMATIFGYERAEDLIGRDLRPLIAPHERARLEQYAAARFQDQPAPPRYEFQGVRRDGSLVWIESLVSMTFVDITERRRAEAALRQSEKLAALTAILAGVAHELNNPLAVILGQTAMLRRTVETGPVVTRTEKIARSAERCARIVRNFLALAREYPPARDEVVLGQIARDVVELFAYQLQMDNIEVILNLAADLPTLWADPHQLHQVLVNLVTNAHHALREAAPPRRLILTTRADPTRTRVLLEVKDTGPGIPPEVQPRIFEPFFTTKPPGQGTGLGLPLCHGIIENHGGSIRVESEPGRGTSFVIELPVETRAAAAAVREVAPAEARGPIEPKAILVVDDEEEVASMLAEMLTADGHRVEIAANGALALEKLRQRAYDLILSDIRMPELDGPGLYREVERRHPGLARRFVFLTGDTLSPETREFLEQKRIPSVTKPFAFPEVRQAVERATRAG